MHTSFSLHQCGYQRSAHTQHRTSHYPLEAKQPSLCASSITSNSGPPSPTTNQTGNAGSSVALYSPARTSTPGSYPSGNAGAGFRVEPYALRVSVTTAAGTVRVSWTSATRITIVPGAWQILKPPALLLKGKPSRLRQSVSSEPQVSRLKPRAVGGELMTSGCRLTSTTATALAGDPCRSFSGT